MHYEFAINDDNNYLQVVLRFQVPHVYHVSNVFEVPESTIVDKASGENILVADSR